MAKMTQETSAQDVLWYVPNKIGYIRVVTAVLSFCTMSRWPLLTCFIYGVSCLLDAVDGTLARRYGQVSSLGAVLDMVTDRSTTSGLLCFLSVAFPRLCVVWQVLLGLDLSSHYMHMYASLSGGSASHKDVSVESSKLLNLYYTRRDVLFMVCAFNEVFYMAVYLAAFEQTATFGYIIALLCLPGYLFKQVANVIQLHRAAMMLASTDAKEASARHRKD